MNSQISEGTDKTERLVWVTKFVAGSPASLQPTPKHEEPLQSALQQPQAASHRALCPRRPNTAPACPKATIYFIRVSFCRFFPRSKRTKELHDVNPVLCASRTAPSCPHQNKDLLCANVVKSSGVCGWLCMFFDPPSFPSFDCSLVPKE